MRILLLTWLAAFPGFCPAGPAPVNTDCTLNFAEFRSALDSSPGKFASLEPVKRDEAKRTLTQDAVLKSGVKVEFWGGGCEHYAYSFTFSGGKPAAKIWRQNIRATRDLLKATPAEASLKSVLVEALSGAEKKASKSSREKSGPLPCGDAICQLEVLAKGKLKVSYSFAL